MRDRCIRCGRELTPDETALYKKLVNRGAEEQFRLENHHPAIVSRAQFAAVQAELARRAEEGEELGITVSVGEVFMDVVHEYPDLTVHLTLFHASIAEGVPQKLEHNDIRWITVDEIDQYAFCPADEVILERLKNDRR